MTAWQEQSAIDRRETEEKRSRIVRVAREHPDMPIALLAERFGATEPEIRYALRGSGIVREPDYIAASQNGIRNKRARKTRQHVCRCVGFCPFVFLGLP